jgi:hypothetical protein
MQICLKNLELRLPVIPLSKLCRDMAWDTAHFTVSVTFECSLSNHWLTTQSRLSALGRRQVAQDHSELCD